MLDPVRKNHEALDSFLGIKRKDGKRMRGLATYESITIFERTPNPSENLSISVPGLSLVLQDALLKHSIAMGNELYRQLDISYPVRT